MKQHPLRDIAFLLSGLMAFSMVIGILFSDNTTKAAIEKKITPENDQFLDLSTKEIIELLTPLIDSSSITRLAQSLKDMDIEQLIPVVEKLINPKQARLNAQEKLDIVFSLVNEQNTQEDAYTILDLLEKYKDLQKEPLFYMAALTGNEKVIDRIQEWALSKKKDITSWKIDAYKKAIDASDPAVLKKLLEVLDVSASQATDLLWQTVEHKKAPSLVPLLLKHGARINDARKGATPLIRAAQVKDDDMIAQLVNLGADIAIIIDPEIGNVLQQAIEHQLTNSIEFLRESGAREDGRLSGLKSLH